MRTKLPAVVAAGAALTLLLAACGDDPDPNAARLLQPPVPVRVVAGSQSTAENDATRLVAADAPAAEGSFMPYVPGFTFEAGPGLPALPTNAVGYQYVPGGTVDAETVQALAEALDVDGEPVQGGGADVDGTLWRVGPDDGSASSITVSDDAQLSWYYSSAWAEGEGRAVSSCATSVDSEGNVTDEVCEEPEPPTGVPDAAAAEASATELLTALGEDASAYTYETYADEWFASVNAWTELDGVRSPVSFGFGFGAEGALQYANGLLADPVATGPYPLIDLDAALARLTDQSVFVGGVERLAVADAGSEVASSDGGGSTGSAGVDAVAPAESASRPLTSQTEPGTVEVDPPGTVPGGTTPSDTLPVNTAPVTTVPGQASPPDTTPVETVPVDVPAETIPVETVPVDPPEPEVAVLVDVRADFWWSWDEDGSIWLLPAYTFTDTEGRIHTVAAVTDEYLIVVEAPVPVEPMPMPDPDVPQTSPEPQVDPAEPVDAPSKVDTSGVVGLTVDEATKVLADRGLTLRVAREDGEDLAVTMDFVETRVNVATEDGVITEVLSVG